MAHLATMADPVQQKRAYADGARRDRGAKSNGPAAAHECAAGQTAQLLRSYHV
jgi:hypothetical protein